MTGLPESDPGAAELFDFVSLFLADRQQRGVRALTDYQARFPGQEAVIAAEYQRLCDEAEPPMPRPSRFGPYEVRRLLGSGGQGTVFLAEDTRLHREVALKVLSPHLGFAASEHLQRFRREAEILSQLDHPGICTVFDADTHEQVPYLAMRYIEGETLAVMLRQRRERDELPRTRRVLHEVMQWIEAAARTVHEAHEAGIVHRDIKPGNLMITPQGQPVVLDFGLARHEQAADGNITRTGAVLGTLAYMAPELLDNHAAAADRRVDVYALGVTLYQCLTNTQPFSAATPTALWHAIATTEPADPRSYNPAIPRELAAVVLTALAKAPAQRYPTALEFAEDLRRVRVREPIRARRTPMHVRAVRMVQRHPTLALAAAALLVLLVVLAISLEHVRANERAASALNRAFAAAASDEGAAAALEELVKAAGSAPSLSLRAAILQVLDGCHLAYRVRRAPVPARYDPPPAIDREGRYLALGEVSGDVVLYDVTTGRHLAGRRVYDQAVTAVVFVRTESLVVAGEAGALVELEVPSLREKRRLPVTEPCHGLALSPDGRLLAVGARGAIVLLDTDQWSVAGSIPLVPTVVARQLVFSPRGHELLMLGRDGCVDPDAYNCGRVVKVAAVEALAQFLSVDEEILWVEWHPNLPMVALAYNGGRVEVRDALTWKPVFQRAVGQAVHWCGFAPGGDLLLVPSDAGTDLWTWRAAEPRVERRLPHPHMRTIGAAGFDASRGLLAAVHRDGTVLVYSTLDWRVVRSFKQRMIHVSFLRWLPASAMLLTGDLEKVSAWHAGVRPHLPEFWGHQGGVTSVAMHPDSRRVLTASSDRSARLWSLDRAEPLHVMHHPAELRVARFSPDGGRWLAIAEGEATVQVRDTATHAPVAALHGHAAAVVDAWFERTSNRVISVAEDGASIVWDVDKAQPVRTLGGNGVPIRSAAAHPTWPWLATGSADRWTRVWNWETGELVRALCASEAVGNWRINPMDQVHGVAFDPTSHLLVASLVNNRLLAWRYVAGWEQIDVNAGRFGSSLLFDPATRQFLCADYSFGLLSVYDGQRLVPLEIDGHGPHYNRIAALKRSAAGGVALSAGNDGLLWVWDLTRLQPQLGVRCGSAILDADFSADGRWVVTGCADGTVKLWPLDPVAAAKAYLASRQ